MAAPAKQLTKTAPAWMNALGRWAYNKSYFPQLGLMRDDCLEETADVKAAVSRLPRHLYNERQYRTAQALSLSMRKIILPKDEWMTMDQDVQYLKPYLEEVQRERVEKAEWAKK